MLATGLDDLILGNKKPLLSNIRCACIMGALATLRRLLSNGNPTAVGPLHWTTVPFSLAAAVNARVEVMSARVVVGATVGLTVFVRVVTKSKSSHCTDATLLLDRLPIVSVLLNRMRALAGRNGSTIQSKKKALVDSAGVSHYLPRTGPSHTHTGVQDNSSCIQDSIATSHGGHNYIITTVHVILYT